MMKNAYTRMYTPEDEAEVLALDLRQADKDELVAAYGTTPTAVISESITLSPLTWVIIHREKIVGIFGVAQHRAYPNVGVPWLLATDELKKIQFIFAKTSRDIVEVMLAGYDILSNVVDTRHTDAIRWLKWLGFTFVDEPIFLFDPDVVFNSFYLMRKEAA